MTYNMLGEVEHVLKRPDTQVGSVQLHSVEHTLVFRPDNVVKKTKTSKANTSSETSDVMDAVLDAATSGGNNDGCVDAAATPPSSPWSIRTLTVCPALGKLCDELLVNVADHKTRYPTLVKRCKVQVDMDTGECSVWNDGPGIETQIHPKWGIHTIQGLFGNFRSSSNFDDTEEKFTGGRNGYGAKLANAFATKFTVETCDAVNRYKQVWRDNTSKVSKPVIRKCRSKSPKTFTKVSFVPDWKWFGEGVSGWTTDMLDWLSTRCAELAGTKPDLEIFFQGVKIPVKGFRAFSKAAIAAFNPGTPFGYCDVTPRWSVGLAATSPCHGPLTLSYVNSIPTSKGGTHVRHVQAKLVKEIVARLKKAGHSLKNANALVKHNLFLTINCMLPNPQFGSQTKEELTLPAKAFKGGCVFTPSAMSKLLRDSHILDIIVSRARGSKHEQKQFSDAKKSRNVTAKGLDDAVWAGTAKSAQCMLFLTEGESAKKLAVSGFSVVGRQKYGVYPLRGKPLNPRQVTPETLAKNVELTSVIRILGLRRNLDYRTEAARKTLRYGSLVVMADQDDDGAHIKGLVFNFIAVYNPTLLAAPNFMYHFVTPIVKVKKNKKKLSFYCRKDYDAWTDSLGGDVKGWTIKYYKGLGTSTATEAKEYFKSLSKHLVPFVPIEDVKSVNLSATRAADWNGVQWMEFAFEAKHAKLRKLWTSATSDECDTFSQLAAQDALQGGGGGSGSGSGSGSSVDDDDGITSQPATYPGFFVGDFRQYCLTSIGRAIPSVMDGLKPSQRKILWAACLRKSNASLKVAELAGFVSEKSAYHHGEGSMCGTIVHMAQNFTGSNNINLLVPEGQFGARDDGGSNAAAARYIFTRLDKVARAIFPADDDPVLDYLTDDGKSIEPVYYVPVIPMALVNGIKGLATGWRVDVPCFDPLQIIDVIDKYLDTGAWHVPPTEFVPFVRGFRGTVSHFHNSASTKKSNAAANKTTDCYTVKGVVSFRPPNTLVIEELSYKQRTDKYLEWATAVDVSTILFGKSTTAAKASARKRRRKKQDAQKDAKGDGDDDNNANGDVSDPNASGGSKNKKKSSTRGRGGGDDTPDSAPVAALNVANMCSDTNVLIVITLAPQIAKSYAKKQTSMPPSEFSDMLLRDWNLVSEVRFSSNTAIFVDLNGRPREFTVEEIFDTHAKERLAVYTKRKAFLMKALQEKQRVLDMKYRFVQAVLDDKIVLKKRSETDIRAALVSMLDIPTDFHDSLLNLPLRVQTKESLAKWTAQIKQIETDVARLKPITPEGFWKHDLVIARDAIETQNTELAKLRTIPVH